MQTTDTLEDLIKGHPFLHGMDPRYHQMLSEIATIRRFAARQQVFQEGGDADHFYLIDQGKVVLETFVPGCGVAKIQELRAGDALGWSWLFPPFEWHFTATTAVPTEVTSFAAAELREMIKRDRDFHNEIYSRIAKTLQQRLQGTRRELLRLMSIRA